MRRVFGIDAPLVRTLLKIGRMILLNLLFLLCSLPVFTLGASWSALSAVLFHGLEDGCVKSFFSYWKRDFKEATLAFLYLAVIGLIVFFDYCLSRSGPGQRFTVFSGVLLTFGYLVLMTACCVFPLIALVRDSTKGILSQGVRLMLRQLPAAALSALLWLLPFLILFYETFWFFKLGYVFLTIWFAFSALISVSLLRKPLRSCLPASEEFPEEEKAESTAPEEENAFFRSFEKENSASKQ